MNKEIDNLSIACIRCLTIDMINKAKSGHPGMALGSAPILYTLFSKHLIALGEDPNFFNRDRFVLSSGHASSLLYAILHLCKYPLSIEDLMMFRQIDSLTPGHPEFRHTLGVDATSGPLGQGIGQAVGIALGEEIVKNRYVEGEKLCSHYTYCLCGDGDLEEGLSEEAIAFAGHNRLNKLILIYDYNKVTLDGGLELSGSTDITKRFKANNWNVIKVSDGNDVIEINKAIKKAKKSDRPTLIIVNTLIGYGSINQNTNKVHGSPLKEDDIKQIKQFYNYEHEEFYVPKEVYEHFNNTFVSRGRKARRQYNRDLLNYKKIHEDEYNLFINSINENIDFTLNKDFSEHRLEATRLSSKKAINEIAKKLPYLVGGSGDVSGSVLTNIDGESYYSYINKTGRNIAYGVREFAMASIQNGLVLHSGIKSFIGCFLVFSDYLKSAIRTASISKLNVIYVFSHDSIALGEDGPTHQPIEQLAMLRSIPNLITLRPADARETYASWQIAINSKFTPVALILSRQNLPLLNSDFDSVKKGAYIISKEDETKKLDAVLLASGSEVSLILSLKDKLIEHNKNVRIVSFVSFELFDKQDKQYQKEILGNDKNIVFSFEMLSSFGWYKYASHVYGIDEFGSSGPKDDLLKKYKFTQDDILKFILSQLD